MSKGNPIVGLAYVVTSQQEMLEKAQNEKDELTKEYMDLLAEKEALERKTFQCERGEIYLEQVEETLGAYEKRIKELAEECNDIKAERDAKVEELEAENDARAEDMFRLKDELQDTKDQEGYFSGEYSRVNKENLELKEKLLMYEQGMMHWQKFVPDKDGRMQIPWGHRHVPPIVDGMYRYTEESTSCFYDEVEKTHIPIKNCYGIECTICTIHDGKLYVYSNGNKYSELIGISVRYIDDYLIMEELPVELIENEGQEAPSVNGREE